MMEDGNLQTSLERGGGRCGVHLSLVLVHVRLQPDTPPPAGAFQQAIEPGIRNYYVAARKTARPNQMAAIFSGATAALTGISALL
jgi:hypothetical protein